MKCNFEFTTEELTKILNGTLIGSPDIIVNSIGRIEFAKKGDITFLSQKQYEKFVDGNAASCIIIPKGYINIPQEGQAFIECENPYMSMVTLVNFIYDKAKIEKKYDIHRSLAAATTAKISKKVWIGPRCVIGENCIIADNVTLHPNVILYNNVIIGEGTVIHSNAVIMDNTIIGKNCLIQPGAVIGADGFGFIENPNGKYEKIPQIGNVIIGDNVEIGANTTIDCALLDSTIIKDGVKIDNLVHIAHNCIINEDTAMAAQAGIAGSTTIGKRNRIGGQVGLAGHISTEDDVILTAQSGVSKSITEKGVYFGSPAKERTQAFKIEANLRRLPDLAIDVDLLKKHFYNRDKE